MSVQITKRIIFSKKGLQSKYRHRGGSWLHTGLFLTNSSSNRFALGLSGGILASVFNSLATGMSPDIPVVGFIVTALIFVIGHGLNLFMNILGSMVHPMRLTFVEFFKNSGYEGG